MTTKRKKPTEKKITTVRLSKTTLARFDACADRRGVSRNLLLQQIIDRFVRDDSRKSKEGVV